LAPVCVTLPDRDGATDGPLADVLTDVRCLGDP